MDENKCIKNHSFSSPFQMNTFESPAASPVAATTGMYYSAVDAIDTYLRFTQTLIALDDRESSRKRVKQEN